MATEEKRHDSKASAPEASGPKRKLPGSFSAQLVKPAQQAALQPLRLPAVSTPLALIRNPMTFPRHSSCHTNEILKRLRRWTLALQSQTLSSWRSICIQTNPLAHVIRVTTDSFIPVCCKPCRAALRMQHCRRRLSIAANLFWLLEPHALALTSSGMSHTGMASSVLLMAAHIAVAAHPNLNAYCCKNGSKACGRTSIPVKLR